MSFVLELPPGAKARAAAARFAESHGLRDPLIATMEECAEGFSFFVVYGRSEHTVDLGAIDVPELDTGHASRDDIEERAAKLGRKLVVVGACTGSDAHTVGIDAILNYKGYAGDKGLESYKALDVHNLGAQVDNEVLASRRRGAHADAILISQVITQRDFHKENARAFVDLAEKQGWRREVLLLLGGPRVDHATALELGFDAGFGPGTKPGEVAGYIVSKLGPT